MDDMRLACNPEQYDYLHAIDFEKDGCCRFIAGGCQCICLNIEGNYNYALFDNNGQIQFMINDKEFTVNFHIEEEIFVFFNEIVWGLKSFDDYPISVFNKRYVFNKDPFDGVYGIIDDEVTKTEERYENIWLKERLEKLKYYYNMNDLKIMKYGELTIDIKKKLDLDELNHLQEQFHTRMVHS